MNLRTWFEVSGAEDQLRAWEDRVGQIVRPSAPVKRVSVASSGPGKALYSCEVLRLQWTMRQARTFGLETREILPSEDEDKEWGPDA